MADTTAAPIAADANISTRPTKPDEAKYKVDLAEAEKKHKALQAEFNAARAKIDGARPGKASGANDRWGELVNEQKEIRAKQSAAKGGRQNQQARLDSNDKEIKRLVTDSKEQRAKLGYKDAKEVETKINQLMTQVESGTLSLVNEKKNLAEASSLRRLLKQFGAFEEADQKIAAKKAENAELRSTFDSAEAKALSEKYEQNQKELDAIKASRDDVNKNFDKLKAQREDLYAKQQEAWKEMQELKDNYYNQRKAFKVYEDQVYQQRREKAKAERDAYEKDKRKKIAEQRLEEASAPAFTDEIITAEGLIRHFDPSYTTTTASTGSSKFAASSQRTVDDSAFKGMSIAKKDEEDFFVGGGGKKKGKKGAKTTDTKFNMSIDIIEGLGRVGVDPPSSQADVPATIEALKKKVENWKKEQKGQTEKNIAKAQAEIAKLEADADAEASKQTAEPRQRGPRTDRSKKAAEKAIGEDEEGKDAVADTEAIREQEADGVADAAKDLKAAKIEESKQPEIATA